MRSMVQRIYMTAAALIMAMLLMTGMDRAWAGAVTSGSLCVTITPAAAVTAGAQWRRIGTSTWRDSGSTETLVPTGNIQVEFLDLGGTWMTPAIKNVIVNNNQTTSASASYATSRADLTWSTYLGGGVNEAAHAIVLDDTGNIYLTGVTSSAGWISGGFNTNYSGGNDAFVMKLTQTGQPLWSTYLGGNLEEDGLAIAVDHAGCIWAAGQTISSGWTSGGFDNSYHGNYDVFIARLDAQGHHLWSSYLGGPGTETCGGIAVDAQNNLYLTGGTYETDWVRGGFDTTPKGLNDIYISKISSGGQLLWSTLVGGSGSESASGIALDGKGCIYLTGTTDSSDWVSGGADVTCNGGNDAFVTKLSPLGEPVWSSYLGGSSDDYGFDIAVSDSGSPCVTGWTNSAGWTTGGDMTSYGGGQDAFVARFASTGQLLWSTYLGGLQEERGQAVALDGAGNCYATGYTHSDSWISGDIDNTLGSYDAYVVKLSLGGKRLWSTYLGGSSGSYSFTSGYGIAVDRLGNISVAGYTTAPGWAVRGYDTSYHGGTSDVFLARLHDNDTAGITGSLQVTISPTQAMAAGAKWRRVGTTLWRESGSTEVGVPYGPCQVEFNSVSTWVAPVNQSITILNGQLVTKSATYDSGASLRVDLRPPEAAAAGAQWRRAGTVLWQDSDTTETGIPTGSGSIEFRAPAGWFAPAAQALTLTNGQTASTSATYIQSASLLVTVTPSGAPAAGAQWRRVGTTTWLNSGTTETCIFPGSYQVEFKSIANWTLPATLPVTLTEGHTTSVTAAYQLQNGSLTVHLAPAAAVAAGAQWRRLGSTTWYDSDTTETDIPAGNVALEFKPIGSLWAAPGNTSVAINGNKNTAITADYAAVGSLCITLTPAAAAAAGAQWRRADTTTWHASGTTDTAVPVGLSSIVCQDMNGWATPPVQSVTVKQGLLTTATMNYVAVGSLKVILYPPETLAAGARWRRVGTTTWNSSGLTETNIPPGNVDIEFLPLSGWDTPARKSIKITQGVVTSTVGIYLRGTLQVTIGPSQVVAAGAMWRRVGTTTWLASGSTENGVPVGSCTVEFKPVTGWKVPANTSVMITGGQTSQLGKSYLGNKAAVGGNAWKLY